MRRSALKDYTRAFKLNKRFAPAYYYCGEILYDRGHYKNALWCYSKAINSDRANAPATFFNARGQAHHWLKHYRSAARDYDEAIRREPTYSQAFNNRGYLRYDRNQLLKALSDYNRAIALDPKNAEALANRADLYADLNKFNLAFQDYTQAIAVDPKNARAHFGLGQYYTQVKGDEKADIKALEAFTKAIECDPRDAPAAYFFNRGLVWEKLEKYDKARDDFTRAVDRDRNHAQAFNHRSIVRKKLKDYLGSQDDLRAACDIDPTICQIRQIRGRSSSSN